MGEIKIIKDKWSPWNETGGDPTLIDVWDNPNRPWPSIVYVETTNYCNAMCAPCLNHRCKRIRGIMSLETFKEIAHKIKKRGVKIGAMFCFGEPLIDPTLFQKYAYAKKLGILTPGHVGLNTNVSLLTPEKYDEILEYTPNIILSFFNVGKKYEALTGGLSWERSYKRAIDFIKYRDKHKPEYPIFISVNTVRGHDLAAVKKAFEGYRVLYVQDAELRWAGSVMIISDRLKMYHHWRCDGYKGALQIKFNGNCEFCAYDIVGTDEGVGETLFGNILEDSWDELDRKFRELWRKPCSLCLRCDMWYHCKTIMANGFKDPDPLPEDWFDWQKPFLKPGESFYK